jgi:hypothetical protein
MKVFAGEGGMLSLEPRHFFFLPVAGEWDLVLCISAYLPKGKAGQMFFCVGTAEEEDGDGSLCLVSPRFFSPLFFDNWRLFEVEEGKE